MKRSEPIFAVCLKNKDYPASLELRKLYRIIPDTTAAKHNQLRVVDESLCEVGVAGLGRFSTKGAGFPLDHPSGC